jgi:hypothetical protein
MANTTHYSLHYTAKSNKPWVAEINCYDQPNGEAGGSRIATIRFFARNVPGSGSVGGLPVVNFSLARFADILAILRSEASIFVGHTFGGPDTVDAEGISSFSTTGALRP